MQADDKLNDTSVSFPVLITRLILLGVLLAAAWLLWSGLYKPLLLTLGAFSCLWFFTCRTECTFSIQISMPRNSPSASFDSGAGWVRRLSVPAWKSRESY